MKTYWFINTFYSTASATVIEKELIELAKESEHFILTTEAVNDCFLAELKKKQDELLEKNGRLKRVRISLVSRTPDMMRININDSTIVLNRVRNSFAIL